MKEEDILRGQLPAATAPPEEEPDEDKAKELEGKSEEKKKAIRAAQRQRRLD